MASNVKVSLTIEGADTSGKKTSTKIPYVNPKISDDTMKTFAEKCAALSTDTHTATLKTTEEDITTGTGKPKFTVTINTTSVEAITFGQKTNAKPLFYGVEGDKPQLTTEYHCEQEDGTIVNVIAPTIVFAASWQESTKNVNIFSDTTGASAFQLTKLIADLHFAETDVTAETTYRLTIADGETTTFVQL